MFCPWLTATSRVKVSWWSSAAEDLLNLWIPPEPHPSFQIVFVQIYWLTKWQWWFQLDCLVGTYLKHVLFMHHLTLFVPSQKLYLTDSLCDQKWTFQHHNHTVYQVRKLSVESIPPPPAWNCPRKWEVFKGAPEMLHNVQQDATIV